MTDLVLRGYNINQINNYANFLKQPLKLEMFVPCDDNGNLLEEPEYHEPNSENEIGQYDELLYQYQQVKEKVLFKGFQYCEKSNTVRNQAFDFSAQIIKEFTIEDLIEFELTLTQTAIEKLGLWKIKKQN
jgi:hypothetical protein